MRQMQRVINVFTAHSGISNMLIYRAVGGSVYVVQTCLNCSTNHAEYKVMRLL
jgi:hypothetical protein